MKTLTFVLQIDVPDEIKWDSGTIVNGFETFLPEDERKNLIGMAVAEVPKGCVVIATQTAKDACFYMGLAEANVTALDDRAEVEKTRHELGKAVRNAYEPDTDITEQ